MNETTRRTVLAGAAGISAALLGACADSEAAPPSAPEQPAANVLAKTGDVPVNGGKIIVEQGVVVTQPTAGEFKAFNATCTHMGCPLTEVENGAILCRCHGAKFALADGSVQAGPAKTPLEAKAVKIENDNVLLA